jgi:DNA-directed RNA polymerase specialized sigma subunit
MKIPLNIRPDETGPIGAHDEKLIERDVMACKRNDWEAKARLVQRFMPLFTSLAKKRASDTAAVNRYIEAGKEGLMDAVRKYKPQNDGKFQIFAPAYIEAQMDSAAKPGFFARLFGRG